MRVFFIFLIIPSISFAELIIYLDGSKGNYGCVFPGGIVVSKRSDELFLFPVPATSKGEFYLDGATISVCEVDFGEERINFRIRKDVNLDKIKREKEILKDIYSKVSPRMWYGEFILPVRKFKEVNENFGKRRVINGNVVGFHKGIDIKANFGTPVFASNSGKVVIARRFTLEGNLVIIDHGMGIFSIYSHLKKINVREGQYVRKGDMIGTVGRSGRATGPHLHFGIKVFGVDVNPFAIFKLSKII